MTDTQLLVVTAPRERRDDLVDVLMAREEISGFTLLPALGYSREHSRFTVAEQVVGYRDVDRFEVLLAPGELPGLLDSLAAAGGRKALRYWVLDCASAEPAAAPGD
jgi:hypothetical protein